MKNGTLSIILALIICVIAFSGCGKPKSQDINERRTKSVKDMAGRTVDIPASIEKVFASGPIGTIMLYTLAPEKMAGINSPFSDTEKRFIKHEYHDIPVLGTWKGTKFSGSIEALLEIKPDVILNVGDVDEKYIADSDEIQKQLNIPVLMVDGSIGKTAEAYEFLGTVLGKEERAKTLGAYYKNVISSVTELIKNIPEEDRIRLYYAEGPKGLQTDTQGTINTEIIDLAGAVNVAGKSDARRIDVSMEQLLAWDPDYIIISTDGDKSHQVYNSITGDKDWMNLKAVRSRNVYEVPVAPYDWINRPPSVNRIIGIQWLANLIYPDIYDIDIEKEAEEFFELFYSYDLSDEELKEILEYSVPK